MAPPSGGARRSAPEDRPVLPRQSAAGPKSATPAAGPRGAGQPAASRGTGAGFGPRSPPRAARPAPRMGTSTGCLLNQDDAEPRLDPPPAKPSSSAGLPSAARGTAATEAALAAGSGQRPAAGPHQRRQPVEPNTASQLGSAFRPPPRSSDRGGEAARATKAPVGKPDAPQSAARTSTTDLTADGFASRKPAGAGARAPRLSQSSGQPKGLGLRSPAGARPAGTHSPRPSQPSSRPSAGSQPSPKAAARLSSGQGAIAAAAAILPQPASGARAKRPLSPESEAKAESIHHNCAHDEDEWYIRVDDSDPQEAELARAASAAGRGIEDICLLKSAADLCAFLHDVQVPETSLVLVDTACRCYEAWAFLKDFADKGGGNLFPVKVAITTDCEAALGEGSQSMPPSRSPTSPTGPSQHSATASQLVQRTVDHERIPDELRVLQDRVPPGGAERGAVQPLDAESLRVVYEDSLGTASGEREGLHDELQAPAADRAALAVPSGPEAAQAGPPRRWAPSADAERFRDIVRAAGEERRMGTDGRPHGRGSFVGSWETAAEVADAGCPDWNFEAWLGSAPSAAVAAVAVALVPQELSWPGGSLAFITAVGRNGKEDREATSRAIAHQLDQNGISLKLASAIVERGVALVDSAAAAGEALNEKFAADGGFEFDFGTKADFFQGLEFRIGPPNPDVLKGMVYDHCENVDSKSEWKTGNYGITTTSRNEFLLVLQDVFDQLKGTSSLGATDEEVDEWEQHVKKPKEEVEKLKEPVHLGVGPPLQWPDETENTGTPRSTNRQDILRGLAKKNKELREVGEKPLLLAEAVALCLYSGPLFEKYNAVCRGGPLPECEREPSKVMRDRFQRLCGGSPGGSKEAAVNRYATTIHVLASALAKASKTSKACTVMRGTKGGRLPKQFWGKDDAGVKGGIEYGFMSTTTDREVAMQHASGQSAGTVLEIQTGMIDRGAELSWISQCPHEKEMRFPLPDQHASFGHIGRGQGPGGLLSPESQSHLLDYRGGNREGAQGGRRHVPEPSGRGEARDEAGGGEGNTAIRARRNPGSVRKGSPRHLRSTVWRFQCR
ncbi:unnamed protein product [Prorocentrum cordatum]|uniref:Mono(ADP-ribosyl)transferase n=1 Tax=Prorocentrum cordatum TaxID=2364126 RepID=A0ABN9PGR8_9DINO|nr:unnamed protein product [Polarella glacialis]